MKKIFSSIPQLLAATAFTLMIGCNSAQTHDDTDRTESENGSSHPNDANTSMTDTTRTATSGMGNDVSKMSDTGFISKNYLDNAMEIKLSKLGKDKGKDAKVTKLATQMIADHTQMLNDLKALASKKHVAPRADDNAADEHIKALEGTTGAEFDLAWTKHMLTMHEAKLAELQSVINNTTDADIKTLATEALPKIQMHRDMLAKQLGGK